MLNCNYGEDAGAEECLHRRGYYVRGEILIEVCTTTRRVIKLKIFLDGNKSKELHSVPEGTNFLVPVRRCPPHHRLFRTSRSLFSRLMCGQSLLKRVKSRVMLYRHSAACRVGGPWRRRAIESRHGCRGPHGTPDRTPLHHAPLRCGLLLFRSRCTILIHLKNPERVTLTHTTSSTTDKNMCMRTRHRAVLAVRDDGIHGCGWTTTMVDLQQFLRRVFANKFCKPPS